MKYRIDVLSLRNGEKRYVPHRHVFWIFWCNMLKEPKGLGTYRGSIFFPDNIRTDKCKDACYSEAEARKVIEGDKKYYMATHGTDVVKIKTIEG